MGDESGVRCWGLGTDRRGDASGSYALEDTHQGRAPLTSRPLGDETGDPEFGIHDSRMLPSRIGGLPMLGSGQ